MFEQMNISSENPELNEGKSILIIGAGGGVGSIAIQLAKKLAKLKVIATASRKETTEWCKELGADFVINHKNDFADELRKIGRKEIDYVFCLHNTAEIYARTADLLKPFGKFCTIVSLEKGDTLDMNLLKNKSGSFAWEFMFTKSSYGTADMLTQHELLNRTAELVDKGIIKTTIRENLGTMNAQNLRKAHAKLESGKTIGKIVLSGIE
jgi:zinc-binding alcohol dehydrogenase family protein